MEIKGTKDGLLIAIENQNWGDARSALIEHIQGKQAFFQGACAILDVGGLVLHHKEISELKTMLSDQEVNLTGLVSGSMVTQEAARKLGLKTDLPKFSGNKDESLKPLDTLMTGEKAILIQKTMRSGYKAAFQGHVIVVGDVNPGAEIVASGSIIVWGSCRGTVHAGADGDTAALVCALDLSPMQLRIASKVTTSPNDQEKPLPEIASIQDEQIIAEPWKQ